MKTQSIRNFTENEHQTWGILFSNLDYSRKNQAHPIFTRGVEALGITADRVPDVETINQRLKELTGWEGVPVEGLEDAASFFIGLKDRKFPIGNFIRDKEDISYTPAPDIFHDLYGHLPFWADKQFADFCQKFGELACRYLDQPEKLRQCERLFWFGVEFPIIKTEQGNRIFGGGILSSKSECNYALSDEPEIVPFDIESIRNRDYRIDTFQTTIFLLENEDQLYNCLEILEAGF